MFSEAFADINVLTIVIAAVCSYLIGSVSPSILQAKFKGIDIRKEGSGNAGTTNTLRVLGKKAAAITLIIDILKGTLAVLLSTLILGDTAGMFAALAVFAGHVWPVYYGFKGGKGVATAFGALLGVNPLIALCCLGVVALVVVITRYMSLGSVMGCVSCPVFAFIFMREFVIFASVLALIIIIKHSGNIQRLVKGEEPKLTFKNK